MTRLPVNKKWSSPVSVVAAAAGVLLLLVYTAAAVTADQHVLPGVGVAGVEEEGRHQQVSAAATHRLRTIGNIMRLRAQLRDLLLLDSERHWNGLLDPLYPAAGAAPAPALGSSEWTQHPGHSVRAPSRRCAVPPCGGMELASIGDDWVKLRQGPGRRR